MHRCWSVPELRDMIINSVDFPGRSSYRTKALLSIATSCKLLSDIALNQLWREQQTRHPADIALNQLWREQQTLYNLIKTMPADLIVDTGSADISFARGLEDSDWERYGYYASKIKKLTLTYSTGVNERVMFALSSYRPTRNLLPTLESCTLMFSKQAAPMLQFSPLILGESLSTLHIYIQPELLGTKQFLTSIPRLCKNLRYLHLFSIEYQPEEYEEPVRRVLQLLNGLTNIEIDILEARHNTIDRLKSLSDLQGVGNLVVGSGENYARKEAWEGGFRALKDLEILVLNCGAAVEVLQALQHTPLRKLMLDQHLLKLYGYTPEEASHTHLFALYSSIIIFTDLTNLNLSFIDAESPLGNAQAEALSSKLLALNKLRTLRLGGIFAHSISNLWLEKASKAFPNLEDLALTYSMGIYDEWSPRTTLRDLLPVLRGCSRLRALRLTTNCEPFDILPLYGISPPPIEDVTFYNSPLDDQKDGQVLRCLLIMFPHARYISGSAHDDIDEGGLTHIWEFLNQRINDCLPIRAYL